MPQDDKQRLADLLKGMSEGQVADPDAAETFTALPAHLPPEPVPAATAIPPRPQPACPAAPEPAPPPEVALPPARPARPAAPPQVRIIFPPASVAEPQTAAVLQSRPSASRRARVAPKQHLVQSHFFKQTTIPIALTLGAICLFLVVLGRLSDSSSPFAGFGRLSFALPVAVIGLLMLVLGTLTILQMRGNPK